MPIVNIKGVGPAQFPDGMSVDDIRAFLRNKYSQRATQGKSDALQPIGSIAKPYEPTLAEKIGQGTSDFLYDKGVISDRYGAQRIGKNLTTIGEFLPGIGDATAGDEFGRAVAQGDKLGMAMAGLGIIPVAGDVIKKLPMDEVSRMARAKAQGFDVDAFHGTTHDFDEFGSGRFEKGGHFGGGHYFSSDIDDVNVNYAGKGPDLTNRIERRAEQLEDELREWDVDDIKDMADRYGIDFDESDTYPDELPALLAKEELQGNEGFVIPTKLNVGKEFDLVEDTHLSYERDIPAWEDYLDDADGDEDIARDLANEASWDNEPEGELVDFMESIKSQADEYGFDADEVLGELQEAAVDGDGLSASEIDTIMRDTEWYAEDPETGDLINNEVYRQAIEDSGFDSIKHAGDIFQGMDIPYGTEHRIIFDPKRIRSSLGAKFDPKNINKGNLLGGIGALGLGTALISNNKQEDNKAQ